MFVFAYQKLNIINAVKNDKTVECFIILSGIIYFLKLKIGCCTIKEVDE